MHVEASSRMALWGFELRLLVVDGVGTVRKRSAERSAE